MQLRTLVGYEARYPHIGQGTNLCACYQSMKWPTANTWLEGFFWSDVGCGDQSN
jgi:hypothetical protein